MVKTKKILDPGKLNFLHCLDRLAPVQKRWRVAAHITDLYHHVTVLLCGNDLVRFPPVTHMGFSTSTCFPAAIASSVTSAWNALGLATSIASTSLRAINSR